VSSYERYDRTAAHYDATRWAAGHEILLGCLAQAARPLARMRLLDAGCGTGNYARLLVERVARIEAVDLEPAMLARARDKLAEARRAGRIGFHRASVLALPFPDASFDGVMANQMLHHLPGRAGDPFWGWRRALAEFARVLRPGGVLAITTCSHLQLEKGYWYYALIPQAAARLRARYLDLGPLEAELRRLGLTPRGRFVPTDLVLMGEAYFDPRGPLDPSWRAGDSAWALVEEEELARALDTLSRLAAAGGLAEFLRTRDALRPEIGQMTVLYAVR